MLAVILTDGKRLFLKTYRKRKFGRNTIHVDNAELEETTFSLM